ncbi:MAG: valine--tRNA ligase [Patescibacteria group bacterium]|nr:valine--tRNA ligase [Patescibacteria group bacterium]
MLDKTYQPKEVEEKIYKLWEDGKYFTPVIDKKKRPFTIILPLPNANDPMHMGHALFTVEDIMARYHRMLGEPTLWLPGADHAGIETQFVFEKKLAKEDKSRFDFDRKTLYQMIWNYVEKNRSINRGQLKKLGFSLDWSRYHYSLEPEIMERVLETFRKLYQDGLIYRGERIVNFCTKCGTAFSDLEVDYQERDDFIYYLDYGAISIATTRPETIFADVAVAVNPKDKKYLKVEKTAVIPLINIAIPVLSDALVQKDFGTGALKITPGYDPVDFEIGQKNGLEIIPIMKRNGRLDFTSKRFASLSQEIKDKLTQIQNLKVYPAREKTVELLEKEKKLIKKIPYKHTVGVCYRCGTVIEPMVIPQWFVKTKPLAKPAIEAVERGLTKIVPKKRFEKMYFDWLKNIRDWNISRQIVWGPQIPVWYCLDCNHNIELNFLRRSCHPEFVSGSRGMPKQVRHDNVYIGSEKISGTYQELRNKYSFEEIRSGLQNLVVPQDSSYQLASDKCEKCQGTKLLQETDTFDTWFLSGQWPVNTLKSNPADFAYFYPTSVLDTLWDILPFWVARMMMLGIYLTGKVPFKTVHLHARVVDKLGQKMSKSKGNVIDPLTISEKYGADALRLALVLGVGPASDISLSEEKIVGMRNFCNKRFLLLNLEGKSVPFYKEKMPGLTKEDLKLLKSLKILTKNVTKNIDAYKFGKASEILYQFAWHEFADIYLENSKLKIQNSKISEEEKLVTLSVLRHVYLNVLKLLHPFIPFVTEEIWQNFPRKNNSPLLVSPWPK